MKKIKILSAVIMCMFAFTLTSYAAEDLFYFDEPVVNGTDVALTLRMDSDAGLTSMSEYSMLYFELGEGLGYDYELNTTITVDEYKGYFADEGDSVLSFTYEGTKEFATSSDYTFTLDLKIVDDTKPLTVKLLTDGYITTADGDDYPEYNETSKTISVAPAGTSTKTVYAEETYALSNETFDFGSEYNFANKYNVVVKYNNAETKTYGWSWKNNLGIEGEGTVTGKVKFGVKISDTSKYDATLFTFDLVEVQ